MTPFKRKLIFGFFLFLAVSCVAYLPLRNRWRAQEQSVLRGHSNGVACWMEGTITNVSVNGESIHLQLTGRFWLAQYHGPDLTQHSVIEIDCKRGISATVSQGDLFFAMSSDWRGGALRPTGELLKILKAAVEHNRVVKFELYDVKIAIGSGKDYGSFTLLDAVVIRATDADLR